MHSLEYIIYIIYSKLSKIKIIYCIKINCDSEQCKNI